MGITSGVILILIGTLVLHLLEEVKTGFRRKLPFGEMPRQAFIVINVIVYAFCLTTFSLSLVGSELAVTLAWIFAIAMALNGMGHIAIMVARRRYFPGGITAFVMLSVAIYLAVHLVSV